MLKIRLQRIGKKGQAYFKIIVTEHTRKPKGKYLELLGSYDPHKNEVVVDAEKVKSWTSQGAHMSETVNNLLVGRGVTEGMKVQVWKPKRRKDGGTPAEMSEKKKAGETVASTSQTPTTVPASETKQEPKEELLAAAPEVQPAS